MNTLTKPVELLSPCELNKYPVWQYLNSDQSGETLVRAVKRIPVSNLGNKVVGDYVTLANGSKLLALLGNIDVNNPQLTEHFLTISVWQADQWFSLSRYHDFDYAEHGPNALARFLNLDIDDIFPISFDIRRFVSGNDAVLVGKILKEPRERLTRAEIIALAIQ